MTTEHKPQKERDLRVPEITRTWERAAKAMPPSDPTNPDDPSVNLDTLAAIANAKWWQAHDLEEQLGTARDLLADVVRIAEAGDDLPEEHRPRAYEVLQQARALSFPASDFGPSLREQLEAQQRALTRIRDWDGFRHTGEVRDCAAAALERT